MNTYERARWKAAEVQNPSMISFYTAVNHNYYDNERTLKKKIINKIDRNLPITTHGSDVLFSWKKD